MPRAKSERKARGGGSPRGGRDSFEEGVLGEETVLDGRGRLGVLGGETVF